MVEPSPPLRTRQVLACLRRRQPTRRPDAERYADTAMCGTRRCLYGLRRIPIRRGPIRTRRQGSRLRGHGAAYSQVRCKRDNYVQREWLCTSRWQLARQHSSRYFLVFVLEIRRATAFPRIVAIENTCGPRSISHVRKLQLVDLRDGRTASKGAITAYTAREGHVANSPLQ